MYKKKGSDNMAKKGGLGMGLDAIFEDNSLKEKDNISSARVTDLEPNKNQPRKKFDEAEIQKLAESINENGLIQPIVVRPIADERYQIVAGERRWRACKAAGIDEIPIIVRELSDEETAKIALIENIQRSDLNPIEEASGYKYLMDTFNITQEGISKIVGKSRSAIANSVRLLNLPDEVQKMLMNNEISAGHAKALAMIDDEDYMLDIAEKAANGSLTVRSVEKIATDFNKGEIHEEISDSKSEKQTNNHCKEIELSLSEMLGRKIRINIDKSEKGTISVEFFDKKDLDELVEHLSLM